MDPDAALARIRELCRGISAAQTNQTAAELADEMVLLIEGLDEWLSKGGFLPAAWSRP